MSRFDLKRSEAEGWLQRTPDYLIRRACVISLTSPLGSTDNVARVTYTGGYVPPGQVPAVGQTALPKDLEDAAIEQIASWFYNREKAGLLRHWPDIGTHVVLAQAPLLPAVRSTLSRYRRLAL